MDPIDTALKGTVGQIRIMVSGSTMTDIVDTFDFIFLHLSISLKHLSLDLSVNQICLLSKECRHHFF